MNISKITLGTAQLGLNYGIANMSGKPDYNTATKILKYSWDQGINTFDTAPAYGNSQEIIGSFVSSESSIKENINIISKLPKVDNIKDISYDNLLTFIRKQVNESLRTLNIEKFHFYLIHNPKDIFLKDGVIIKCLDEIKKEGLIEHIGISIYNPEEVEASLNFKEIDVIQIPINIFDHRLTNTGLLKALKKKKNTIFARSIYLQGLFFLSPKNLPENLKGAKDSIIKLKNISEEYNITIPKLTLLYVRDISEIDSMIIGVEKIEQIKNNLKILREKPLQNEVFKRITEEFSELSEKVINPTLWNK